MKNKIKIFIALGITLITTLIFTISTFAQTGYQVNDNGNIVSLNLFDGELVNGYHSGSNGNLTLTNGSLVTNKNLISLNHNTYYTISFVANNIYLDGINYYYSNGSFKNYEQLNNQISPYTFFLSNDEYFISFNFISNTNINYTQITNVMLNEGQTALDYFPYGNYYDNKYTSLYQTFNNANVKLYNLTNNNLILQENINITNSNVYNLQNDTINIANYLNNEEGNNRYYYIIIELNQSINNTLILNTYNDTIEANAKIYSYNEIYSQSYIRQENKDYIQIEATNYYNYIYYDGFYTPDYTKLEISLNIDSINYSRGYNTGYDEGYESGYIEGKASGKTEGKINANSQIDTTSASYIYGYEQGQLSNNSLQGMVISIAETPINIFKQIFDFNILGFDITQFLFSIVSLLLVVFLIKKIIK